MTGKTIAEKILSAHSGKDLRAGDIAYCSVDKLMAHDANGPLAIQAFRKMNGTRVVNPQNVYFIMDHGCPAPYERIANLQKMMREFAAEQSIHFLEGGEGVCHQLMLEKGYVCEGELVLGTDSHTCTYGAVGAFSTGVGATDMGVALLTGKNWFKVPESIRVTLTGELCEHCEAKDIILTLLGIIGAAGANYRSLELYGTYFETCTLADKMTIANMIVEMGGKCGFICDSSRKIHADPDARYVKEYCLDLAQVVPCVAKPHLVDNYAPVSEVAGTKIDCAFLGSCTNGRLQDLHAAAKLLSGKQVAKGVRLIVAPASRDVMTAATEDGTLETLLKAGAVIFPPGCGVCVGTHGGVPADTEVAISTANRNFKGRMGNNKAFIYLASARTVAASCLTGVITDPRDIGKSPEQTPRLLQKDGREL